MVYIMLYTLTWFEAWKSFQYWFRKTSLGKWMTSSFSFGPVTNQISMFARCLYRLHCCSVCFIEVTLSSCVLFSCCCSCWDNVLYILFFIQTSPFCSVAFPSFIVNQLFSVVEFWCLLAEDGPPITQLYSKNICNKDGSLTAFEWRDCGIKAKKLTSSIYMDLVPWSLCGLPIYQQCNQSCTLVFASNKLVCPISLYLGLAN